MNTDHYKNKDQSEEELDQFTRKQLRIKFNQEKKQRWEQLLKQNHNIRRQPSLIERVPRRKLFYALAATAAALALILMLFPGLFATKDLSATQLASKYLKSEKFPNLIAPKGHAANTELQLKAAEAYNSEDYKMAITFGEQLVAEETDQTAGWFYLALSYLYSENYKEAIRCLKEVRRRKGAISQYQQEADWFIALSYIKSAAFENAKKELEGIVSRNGWQKEKAQLLLEVL